MPDQGNTLKRYMYEWGMFYLYISSNIELLI